MKKYLLVFVMILSLTTTTHSQTLQNTYWRTYNYATNMPTDYLFFAQDTFWASMDNINYDSLSVYTTNGNIFTIVDVVSGLCPVTDTGIYNFSISADTLRFNVIHDTCLGRENYFHDHYYLSLPTFSEELNYVSMPDVYPNPSPNGIFNLSFTANSNLPDRIDVYTVEGRKIW